ncbi:MarR family transcriptional regulator [Niastella vici]|uniref:HTH-type transcriptional regulator SarZ n=1 Tax=Niastella vici TaxID=1703345 RepID=A0A1V9G6R5_9BACT|nr:MarR family transcriptional regulator [Niastella vici]OQP66252.1 MarR family transcriptional regulator [Niastella vici]
MEDKLLLSSQVCFPIYTLAKEIVNQYRPLLNDLDLTYPQYLVMLVLWEQQEQTVNQLGEKLKLDSGTLTPLLKRLAQKGLVARNRDEADERVVNITLTKEGKKLKAKAQCIPQQLAASMKVSVKDLQLLKNLIEKILSNYN